MTNEILTNSLQGSEQKRLWVEELAKAGYPLIPLISDSKVTYDTGWQHTEPNTSLTAADFPYNYGVVIRHDRLVIDADPRNFEEGDNPLARLMKLLGIKTFDTYIVQSGGGGLHVYLRIPEGVSVARNVDGYKGLEFKSTGNFVVGPGSIHPKTRKEYVVKRGHPAYLMGAPAKLMDLVSRAPINTHGGIQEPDDSDSNCKRAIKWLSKRAPAISGQQGDAWTVKTAAGLRDLGLSEEKAFELMLTHWNDFCEPPWPPNKLALKVKNAYKYTKDAFGNKHPAALFEVAEKQEIADTGTTPKPENTLPDQWNRDRIHIETEVKARWDCSMKDGSLTLKNTLHNVKEMFRIPSYGVYHNPLHQLVKKNMHNNYIDFSRPAPWHHPDYPRTHWNDNDTRMVRSYFSTEKHWNPSQEIVMDAVFAYAEENPYHPIRNYFNSLEWDGVPRMGKLFSYYCGADRNGYTESVARCMLIAAVARTFIPGCKYDNMVVLEGPQGSFKSGFCSIIGSKVGHREINIDPHNKDTVLYMQGELILEVSEMVCARKADVDSLKSFLSRTTDKIRPPYDRGVQDFPRQSIFIGTTNPDKTGKYMKDMTGNRRFWFIKTRFIRDAELRRDIEQIWAEAVHAYNIGEDWYLKDPNVVALAAKEQYDRTETEIWAEYIGDWLAREKSTGVPRPKITTEFILTEILNMPIRTADRNSYVRVSNAMAELGWLPCLMSMNGRKVRGYFDPAEDRLPPEFVDQLLDGL